MSSFLEFLPSPREWGPGTQATLHLSCPWTWTCLDICLHGFCRVKWLKKKLHVTFHTGTGISSLWILFLCCLKPPTEEISSDCRSESEDSALRDCGAWTHWVERTTGRKHGKDHTDLSCYWSNSLITPHPILEKWWRGKVENSFTAQWYCPLMC